MDNNKLTLWNIRSLAWAVGLALVAPAARAQTETKIEPIVALGDTVAGLQLNTFVAVGALNDKGQAPVLASLSGVGEGLLFDDGGTFTPIVVGGREAPGGTWPRNNDLRRAAMNARGNVVFASTVTIGGATSWGIFRWDPRERKTLAVALAESRAFPPTEASVSTAGERSWSRCRSPAGRTRCCG